MSVWRLLWVVLLAAYLTSCTPASSPETNPSPSASLSVVDVDVVPVRVATLDDEINAVGNFRAITEANVSPKNGGLVVDVPVHLGQFVASGAALIQLDTADILAQLAQDRADIVAEQTRLGLTGLHQKLKNDANAPAVRKAQATLENNRLQWERSRNLYRSDLIAQKDLQDAKAQYVSAMADYQSALDNVQTNKANVALKRTQLAIDEQRLRNATVRAPFAGYIASRNVNPGDYVQSGGRAPNNQEYMKLITIDPIYCTLSIPELYSQRLKRGQPLRIKTVAFPGRLFGGHVSHVSPALDPSTRTIKVDATIDNPGGLLKPGLYGTVKLQIGQIRDARMVPQSAQVEMAGTTRVYVVEEKKGVGTVVRGIPMKRGRVDGNWIQADEAPDLMPSMQVVVSNLDRLYDGARVKVGKTLTEPPALPQLGN